MFCKSFLKAIHIAITYEDSNRMDFVGKTEGKESSSKTQENRITENREKLHRDCEAMWVLKKNEN